MSWRNWLGRRRPLPVNEQRWLVIDAETSGLDPHRDRLLALAAVALRVDWTRKSVAIDPADSFEVVLRQQQGSSKDNILLHGIGVQSQLGGLPAAQALAAFAAFIGDSPLLAFHAGFDRELLARYAQNELGQAWPNPWGDIEHLCAVTHEKVPARSLDEWLAHFGLACTHRHQAAADAMAEAELLLRVWPRVAAQCRNWRDVQQLATHQDWLRRQ
ncbi:MAG: 3'-5' exonuclease [Burkholderiales bacterium]